MSVCFEIEQESENALAIRIRDLVFEKLKDCTTEEQLKDALLKILSENDDTLDIEKIQNDKEVSYILDSFVACSVDTNLDNLDGRKVQIADLLKNAINTICNPPTFSIPYPFPIFDLSADFLEKIKLALIRLAIKILISIIKKLLSLIIDICNSGLASLNGYGINNITNILTDSIGGELSQSFIGEVFNSFGINTDGTAASLTIGEEEECTDPLATDDDFREAVSNIKNVNKFLDDLSMMATPVELCSLLNNKANESTFLVVEELLRFEYPEIRKRLHNRTKIAGLFKTLGSRSDPAICQLVEDNAELITSSPDICFTTNAMQIREGLLKERNLSDDEIKKIIKQERDRNKKNFEKLNQLAAAINTNPNKILGEPPNIFCKGNESGIVSLEDMPSLKESISEGLDISFNTFAYVFDLNSSNFVDDVLVNKSTINLLDPIIPKFIDKTIIDDEGETQVLENSLNDKFLQRVSNGKFTLCDYYGRTDKESLLDYYDFKINDQSVIVEDVIDTKLLAENTNYDAHDENVYIINYNFNLDLTPDVINISNTIDNYLSLDYENLSISISIPNKLVLPSSIDNTGDFSKIPSMQTIKLFTVSGSTS